MANKPKCESGSHHTSKNFKASSGAFQAKFMVRQYKISRKKIQMRLILQGNLVVELLLQLEEINASAIIRVFLT
jgi:hypothetical protein